jgi:hypothetical protein
MKIRIEKIRIPIEQNRIRIEQPFIALNLISICCTGFQPKQKKTSKPNIKFKSIQKNLILCLILNQGLSKYLLILGDETTLFGNWCPRNVDFISPILHNDTSSSILILYKALVLWAVVIITGRHVSSLQDTFFSCIVHLYIMNMPPLSLDNPVWTFSLGIPDKGGDHPVGSYSPEQRRAYCSSQLHHNAFCSSQ